MDKIHTRIREVEAFVVRLASRGKLEPDRMTQVIRALKKLKKAIETTDNRLLRKAVDALARSFLNMGN